MKPSLLLIATLPLVAGSAYAVEPNFVHPENLPIYYRHSVVPPASESPDAALNSVYAQKRRWENGRVLRVCMFDGDESVVRLIREVAGEWNKYSSVKFDFGPSPSGYNCLENRGFYEIKVHFGKDGYWSLIGKDSVRIAQPVAPSMNLYEFNITYSELNFAPDNVVAMASIEHKAIILHEFGHALGLLHEHQNPKLNCQNEIKWTGQHNAYDYYWKYHRMNKPDVDRNIGFISLSDPDFVALQGDVESIMIYPLPAQIMKNPHGPCVVPAPLKLSKLDKEVIAKIYPPVSNEELSKDLELATDSVSSIPASLPIGNRDGLLERALADLESSDTFTRRDARVRLAELLQQDKTRKSEIIKNMPTGSYRYQLGVSTALLKGKQEISLTHGDRDVLKKISDSATDESIKNTLNKLNSQ
jgi:hypothetical protein